MIEASFSAAKPARPAVHSAQELTAGAAPAGGDSGIAEQFAALLMLLASGTPVAGATVAPNAPDAGGDGKPLPSGGQSLPLAGSLIASLSSPTVQSLAPTPTVPTTPESPNDTAAIDATLLEFATGGRTAETAASRSHRLPALGTLDQVLAAASRADLPGAAGVEPTLVRADPSTLSQALAGGSAPAPADGRATSLPAGPLPSALPTAGTPDFDPALGERVLWMMQQGQQSARVRVHPEHLGPIDIRLKLDGDSAQITLTAGHVVARDALEQALPRLRDMLGHAGVTLTHADVSDRGAGAHDSRSHLANDAATSDDDGVAEGAASELIMRRPIAPAGLIDRFA